jgi:hypothetical protein
MNSQGNTQQKEEQQMLARMQGKRNPHTLLMLEVRAQC